MIIHCHIQRLLKRGILLQLFLKRFTATMRLVFVEKSIIIHFVKIEKIL